MKTLQEFKALQKHEIDKQSDDKILYEYLRQCNVKNIDVRELNIDDILERQPTKKELYIFGLFRNTASFREAARAFYPVSHLITDSKVRGLLRGFFEGRNSFGLLDHVRHLNDITKEIQDTIIMLHKESND